MAVDIGFTKPTGRVFARDPVSVREMSVASGTNMYPGRVVIESSTDNDVTVNDTSNNSVAGILGYEQAGLNNRPATISTAYATDELAPVCNAPGILGKAWLYQGHSVSRDQSLNAAPDGCVGDINAESTTARPVIIAYAVEDVDNSSGTTPVAIWVRWSI